MSPSSGVSWLTLSDVHWWDWTTPIPEVMQGLNTLIKQGKVLYLGVSDTPAWVISRANQYARDHGLAPFVLYQGRWSVADRDLERELLPMCISEGMGIAPWGAIGQGKFQRKKDQGKSTDGRSKGELTTEEKAVSASVPTRSDAALTFYFRPPLPSRRSPTSLKCSPSLLSHWRTS
jgi:aryl-alcohol dehydrogenase-like predicted oxidoreductase